MDFHPISASRRNPGVGISSRGHRTEYRRVGMTSRLRRQVTIPIWGCYRTASFLGIVRVSDDDEVPHDQVSLRRALDPSTISPDRLVTAFLSHIRTFLPTFRLTPDFSSSIVCIRRASTGCFSDMIGVDAAQRSFCFALACLSGETEEHYTWVLERLKSLYEQFNATLLSGHTSG